MSSGLRIAQLEHDANNRSATGVRGRAIATELRAAGHTVTVLSAPESSGARFARSRFGLFARARRRLLRRRTLPHYWDHLANHFEPLLRTQPFDVIIGRGQDVAHVFTRGVPGLTILDMANVLFLESYYQWGANLAEVNETFEKERELLRVADYVLSPHEMLSALLLDHFVELRSLSARLVTVPLGATIPARIAGFAAPPRIVYAGSYHYIQDPYLLATLARRSPYAIDCYGPHDPNQPFLPATLNYRGFVQDESFLAGYQFGLITLSRDRLRQSSPATKLPYYLAHGLPVLFPEWMREGHLYPDCAVPYTEETFASVVTQALLHWPRLHEAALARGAQLTWPRALAPLIELLERVRIR